MELVQELLERFLSCLTGRGHRRKKRRGLRDRASSSSTINLPPPRVRRGSPALHDKRSEVLLREVAKMAQRPDVTDMTPAQARDRAVSDSGALAQTVAGSRENDLLC
jgi:hypothetical protein